MQLDEERRVKDLAIGKLELEKITQDNPNPDTC